MFSFFTKKDSEIQSDVQSEITWDPSISSSNILASSADGIVTLRGHVPYYYEKSQAVRAAQRVGGVRAVADEIEVNMMGSYNRTDEDIAQAALRALEWNYVAAKDVKVAVEKGWITLNGEVEWDYKRRAAEDAVMNLMSVWGVTNSIQVNSKVHAFDIENRIELALKRSAAAECRNISVTISGDKAILSGHVHSFAERSVARQAAWMAPGINSVENNLTISQ